MRFKSTWVLLGLAAAAGAYFFFVEQPRHRQQQATSKAEQRLTTLLADDVHEVRVERPDGTLVFQLTADGWHMSVPVTDMAEDVKVNTLVRSLTDAIIDRRLNDVKDHAEYGLGKPAAVVTLAMMPLFASL